MDVNFSGGYLKFDDKEVPLGSNYDLKLNQILIVDDFVFVLGLPYEIESNEDVKFKDNVFAFNKSGDLLWNSGLFDFILSENSRVTMPATYMALDNNYLKLYYQSDHEVWLDRLTGEKIKEEFVFKK